MATAHTIHIYVDGLWIGDGVLEGAVIRDFSAELRDVPSNKDSILKTIGLVASTVGTSDGIAIGDHQYEWELEPR